MSRNNTGNKISVMIIGLKQVKKNKYCEDMNPRFVQE